MSVPVLHAGSPDTVHLLVDTAVSVGAGVTLVVLYLVVLRYVVAGERGVR